MLNLFKSKIFKRQFSYFFIIILFTFTTISGVIFAITKNSEEKQLLEIAKSYRMETAYSINRWLVGREEFIRIQTDFFEKMSKEELSSEKTTELIKKQLKWNKYFHDMVILDEKGDLVNSKDGDSIHINVSDRDYFQNIISETFYIEGLVKGKKDGVPIMIIAYPFKINEKENYMLAGLITFEKVIEIVEALNLEKMGRVFLINNEGLRITDNEYINELTKNGEIIDKSKYKVKTPVVSKLLAKESGTESYRNNYGEKVYGSYEWLSILNMGLVVQFDDRIVMKPLNDLTRLIILLGIIVIVLGFISAFAMSRKIVEPIYMLVESAQHIALNNYKEPVKISTSTEIDILIDRFNSMQQAIRFREEQLIKKNEELKVQRAEAVQANILKSQFLANMSHELRTPLNSIIGFTGRVLKKCGETLPNTQKENLEIVKDEAQHLLALINDLLDYSKIEAGKMEVNKETFNMVDVINEVYNMMKNLMVSKPIQYVQSLHDEKLTILSDRMKIKQILINLVSNAVKYSEKGTITLSVEMQADEYIIKVSDEGIGIAKEHLQNIFDEFRQIDGSYTRKVGGTGLGLSITKKFIEMLGGNISVESVLGAGSTFTIRLPQNITEREKFFEERKNNVKPLMPNAKRIVCIDDDQNVQRLYREYLSEQDYEIVSLYGNEDVISEIKNIHPEAIILDIILPQKDGWDILAELKTDKETKKIPVIMASVLSESKLAFRMNADEYLIKPILQDEFVETIKRTINNNGQIDVLIADDDDNYLNLIAQFLQEEHISFRLARSGNEAIERINEKVPDLLLLDLMMPDKDGFSVIEDIEKMPECKSMSIIVVTAKDLTLREKSILNKRTKAVIQKSGIHVEEIMNILVKWIGERLNG